MNSLTIPLFGRICVPTSGQGKPAQNVEKFNLELNALGYTLSGDAFAKVRRLSEDDFLPFREKTLADLTQLVGSDRAYYVLFSKFPYSQPDQHSYLLKRVVGFLQNEFHIAQNDSSILSCGHVIDKTLFDLNDFGACPICQFQVDGLEKETEKKYDFRSVTRAKVLEWASDAFLAEKANATLSRNASINVTERAFLKAMIAKGTDLQKPKVLFKENLPFAYEVFDIAYILSQLSGATDVLRIATYLSDANADLSLAENTKFKIKRSDKKKLLGLLEGLGNLEEDLMRHREKWLRFGEIVNPTTDKNRRTFPKVATAFDAIRNNSKSIDTFSRFVQNHIDANQIDEALIERVATRGGEFIRRFDAMLRKSSDPTLVLRGLSRVAPNVEIKALMGLSKYLSSRNEMTRVFFPKGQVTKAWIPESDDRQLLPENVINDARYRIAEHLQTRLSSLGRMGAVYIDPELKNILVPFNQRGDSTGLNAMVKGSAYPISTDTSVLRLFVWWKGRIDVDLSVNLYDDRFIPAGYVGYLNQTRGGILHSGDIQNAPNGAAEFIDIDLNVTQHARYVVVSAISFRGESFNTFPCFAGYMERDAMKSGEGFEPESVAVRLDIKTPSRSHVPLIFDIKLRQVIVTDVSTGGGSGSNSAKAQKKFAALLEAAVGLRDHKLTLYDVLETHVMARGVFASKKEADTIFDHTTVVVSDFSSTYLVG